jgi:hypothetical protein
MATNRKIVEAAQFDSNYKSDRQHMRTRAAAGLDVLRKQPVVDSNRMGDCANDANGNNHLVCHLLSAVDRHYVTLTPPWSISHGVGLHETFHWILGESVAHV